MSEKERHYSWIAYQCWECGVVSYSPATEEWFRLSRPTFCGRCGAKHETSQWMGGKRPPGDYFRRQVLLIKPLPKERVVAGRQQRKASGRVEISPRLRFEVLKRDDYQCQLCGKRREDGAVLHVDHRVPIAKGGTNHPSNLWTLCQDCNLGKGIEDV